MIRIGREGRLTVIGLVLALVQCLVADAQNPRVSVSNIRRVFDNGEHNAFTDLIKFDERYYLTFRTCPDGHMVHPTSAIVILSSADLHSWDEVNRFSVPLRDVRDPHFLEFKNQLFVFTGTWYCGETSPKEYDLNDHLGYAVYSADGSQWSKPQMLEGTFGHYIWKAGSYGETAYLCGRRKRDFDMRPRKNGPVVESAMLASSDGLSWYKHRLFQPKDGDETAFKISSNGELLGVARRGREAAELLRSQWPFDKWERTSLDRYIGGPLLAKWGERWVVGGRKILGTDGAKTALYWLDGNELVEFAELPSGGDNSYPGFIALEANRAVVSWYSSHETDLNGKAITAIYMADLKVQHDSGSDSEVSDFDVTGGSKQKFVFKSSFDGSEQETYLTIPPTAQQRENGSSKQLLIPMVVSLHSWSGDLEQKHQQIEGLVGKRNWFCLQPNFRGVNDHPEACGSPAAQQDIVDAVKWALKNYPIDPERVFLTGTSGGGHMTMMMSAKHPELWASASAWVGISDMAAWYEKHEEGRYGEMMRKCCGGAPEDSPAALQQYRQRSPMGFLEAAKDVALDISAGIHDGHSGSVPVRQSLEAFNVIASANGEKVITEEEIIQLSVDDGRLEMPTAEDRGFDATFGREFYLRRTAGSSRVTIFEGGHEGIANATMAWFDAHSERRDVGK